MAFEAYGALATEPTFVDKTCLGQSLQHSLAHKYSSSYKISPTLMWTVTIVRWLEAETFSYSIVEPNTFQSN